MSNEGPPVAHIRPETIMLVERALFGTPREDLRLFAPDVWRYVTSNYEASRPDIDQIRKALLHANRRIEDLGLKPVGLEESSLIPSWLYYDEILETIQIYDDAVSLQHPVLLVNPSDVKSLLAFFPANSRDGVVLENHGPGYHFHYGKVRSGTFERTNLLLTFNPEGPESLRLGDELILWGCPHGHYPKVNMALMGKSMRYPVYEVCRAKLRKHPLSAFMKPLSEATCFFPEAADV